MDVPPFWCCVMDGAITSRAKEGALLMLLLLFVPFAVMILSILAVFLDEGSILDGIANGLIVVLMAICRGSISGVVAREEEADEETDEVADTCRVLILRGGIVFPFTSMVLEGLVPAKSEHAMWFLMTVFRIPRAMYSTRVWISS